MSQREVTLAFLGPNTWMPVRCRVQCCVKAAHALLIDALYTTVLAGVIEQECLGAAFQGGHASPTTALLPCPTMRRNSCGVCIGLTFVACLLGLLFVQAPERDHQPQAELEWQQRVASGSRLATKDEPAGWAPACNSLTACDLSGSAPARSEPLSGPLGS